MNARIKESLLQIIDSAKRVGSYIEGMEASAFLKDERTQYAVAMNLIIIGERARNLAKHHETFVRQHPRVPWRLMAGMRNVIAHDYNALDLNVVWETVTAALPELRQMISAILTESGEAS